MSGPVGVGGFEEGEIEGDGPLEKVAAQILLRGADAVQLRGAPLQTQAPCKSPERGPTRSGAKRLEQQRIGESWPDE